MSPNYKPIVVDIRMSDYGYWVVTISADPTHRVSVMICSVGITREQAGNDALLTIAGTSARKAHQ